MKWSLIAIGLVLAYKLGHDAALEGIREILGPEVEDYIEAQRENAGMQ